MFRVFLSLILCIVCVANVSGDASTVIVPDTMAERVRACTVCHTGEDKIERDAYYPRLAGKSQGYLFNQLRHFRDGRRIYPPMAILLENMSDEYLQEIAQYFSLLQLPYPKPEQFAMRAEEIASAERLIYSGIPQKNIPACSACHGDNLMGVEPAIPGLLGLSRAYITAQLNGWRGGSLMRSRTSECMYEVAKGLSDEEVNAIAKWLARQTVAGKHSPFSTLAPELAQRCDQRILPSREMK
ncbi:MAG: cytochrome c4 [Nitrosomonas sp.]